MKKILISKRDPTVLDSSIFISDDSSYFLWCFVHHRVLTLFDPFIPIILFVFNSALEVTLTVLLYCPFQRGITLFKLFSTNPSHCQKDDSQTQVVLIVVKHVSGWTVLIWFLNQMPSIYL